MRHLQLLLSFGLAVAAFSACQTQADGPSALTGEFVLDDETAVEVPEAHLSDEEAFLVNAFPPMLPDSEAHQNSWLRDDCILCHETGVSGAPLLRHRGLPPLLRQAKCRSCHVAADPDAEPLTNLLGEEVAVFSTNAFPPTMPVDDAHQDSWMRQDCLLCHKWGVGGASKVRHTGMSELLLQAKCRTCHLPGANANGL